MCLLKNLISFTPHTPRSILFVVRLTIAFMPVSATLLAQSVVLDSLPVYEQSYRQYMLQRWTAERREFLTVNRKKWWYYVPSMGWSFHSPSINANTGVLAQIDYSRTATAAKLVSLDSRYQVDFTETLQRIRHEYQKLLVRAGQLERERRLLDKLRGIQAIHNEAFNAQTMTPEEHLRNSYSYERAISDFRAKEADLTLAVLDFFELCRFAMPKTQLAELADNEDCPAAQPRTWQPNGITVVSETAPRR